MARIDELAGRKWRAGAAGAPHADPQFRAPSWRSVDLDEMVPRWRDLARGAAHPNPFFAPWFLLPSLEQFDRDGHVRLAMLEDNGRVVGLLPFSRRSDYHGRRLPHLAIWCHANCFCGEPLILPDFEDAFWRAFLAWCDRHYRTSLFLHLSDIPADGASVSALGEICRSTGRSSSTVHSQQRAMLLHGPSPEEHMRQCLVKKRRKELARKRRRLEETGDLVFRRECDDRRLESWIEDFLALEKQGWKGREGSALANDFRTESLFRQALHDAARQGRLERLAFYLDARPIAMLCNFVTPPGSFSFKTAYDESLAKLSPGVLLQVENLAVLERDDVAWSDSCAQPGHPMIDHFWRERRDIAKINVAIGGAVRRTLGAGLMSLERARMDKRA